MILSQRLKHLLSCTAAVLATLTSPLAMTTAQAQTGLAELRAGALPFNLVYPTAVANRAVTQGPFTLQVAPDATPQRGNGRLVVLSHGTGGSLQPDMDLAQALVRAGFVVAVPLHQGDNFRDMSSAGPKSFEKRPLEVLEVINILSRTAPWSGLLQLDRVGVHGMSAGGTTGLQLAGAQWTMLTMIRHCNANLDADAGFCFNGATDPAKRAERAASYARARNVPEIFLPSELKTLHGGRTPTPQAPDPRPDARIAAVTLAVPVSAIFTPESLARIRIPVGLVTASADQVLVPQFHSEYVLTHCKSCTRLMELGQAGHFDVLSPWPASVAADVAQSQVRGGQPTPGFDARRRDEAHQRIVDFHRKHLL